MYGMNTQPFTPPCKAGGKPCEKRRIGCQGECEAYMAYKANIEKWRREKQLAHTISDYTGAAVARAKQSGPRMPRTILYDAKKREAQNINRHKPPKIEKIKHGNTQENMQENREEKGK